MMKRLALASVAASLLAACTPSTASSPWLAPSEGQKEVRSGSPLETYFPLVDGMVYTYRTLNEVGEEGLLVARVHRTDARHGELRFPNGSRMFEYTPDGVILHARTGEVTHVLKAPLAVGTTWRGEHGGKTSVLDTNVSVDTPVGHHDGCVRTREERLGDRPVRYATVFCPGVGVVSLEVATGANYERAELKTYAPPMRILPDGVVSTPGSAP
jgi:hypothetical protein